MNPTSILTKQQSKSEGPRPVNGYGAGAALWAHLRYDDQCGNGHNTFSITGTVRVPNRRDIEACGCVHDEITEAFPHLAPLIKWRGCSSDGPLHYIANTLYLAGNRDHYGYAAGEPSQFDRVVKWNNHPIEWEGESKFIKWLSSVTTCDFEVLPVPYVPHGGSAQSDYKFKPKYTLGGYDCEWHQAPFDTEREAVQFLEAMRGGFSVVELPVAFSEGKARELDSARRAAIWPEATDAELCQEPEALKAALLARLPTLMDEFKAAMESLGFIY